MPFVLKKPTTFDEQLSLYECRGMIIPNREAALSALKITNYYRLNGYTFHMKKNLGSEEFATGSCFDTVLSLYDFDNALRNILIRYLGMIEIFVRTQISYFFSHACGSYGHYNPINFMSYETCDEFVNALDQAIEKNQEAPFVRNHINKYSNTSITPPIYNMPLWAAVEILSMSTLSKFYKSIGNQKLRTSIASEFKISSSYLDNRLHSLSNLRNICAHCGRIYNRSLNPKVAYDLKTYHLFSSPIQTDRFFGYLPAIMQMLPLKEYRFSFIDDLINLNLQFTGKIDLTPLGYSTDWQSDFSMVRTHFI